MRDSIFWRLTLCRTAVIGLVFDTEGQPAAPARISVNRNGITDDDDKCLEQGDKRRREDLNVVVGRGKPCLRSCHSHVKALRVGEERIGARQAVVKRADVRCNGSGDDDDLSAQQEDKNDHSDEKLPKTGLTFSSWPW